MYANQKEKLGIKIKSLTLQLVGHISYFHELIVELSNLGHDISYTENAIASFLDCYILFFNKPQCLEWINNNKNLAAKAILCTTNQIIAFKGKDEWYQLYQNKLLQSLTSKIIVETINLLSNNNLEDYEIIKLDIGNTVQTKILSLEKQNNIPYLCIPECKPFPENKTIHALFEQQVKQIPDNIR